MKKDPSGASGYIVGDAGLYAIIFILGLCFYGAYQAPSNEEILAKQAAQLHEKQPPKDI